MNQLRIALFAFGVAGLSLIMSVQRAHACGGLFCNRSQPVNQAAERILFVENGDGSVTAVIEIKYEGPSSKFSWVLPVPGVPTVGVSSTSAFDQLQAMSNPQYTLQTMFKDCSSGGLFSGKSSSPTAGGRSSNDSAQLGPTGVSVLAAGTVGPFDYQVIMVDNSLSDPADVAVKWLSENGYEVGELGPSVLRPYLKDNLNLLAFRLSKDSMSGSIRPVVIKYESEKPFIPIRPTAVAANDDMGVMVFVVGKSRAIPSNYKALELNEARIDWFNPMTTYGPAVNDAADEAGGQGFVTEYAQPTMGSMFVLNQFLRQQWQSFSTQTFPSGGAALNQAKNIFAGYDGFVDAVRMTVKDLPANITVQDVINCPTCYEKDVSFSPTDFQRALYEQVYKPLSDTEDLLHSRPYLTRLYTTMSADEMTVDPSFDFNADLPAVSNVHTAMQVIDCNQSWTVTLPQGDVVAGKQSGVWPGAAMSQPAARTIAQLAQKGAGKIVVDNSAMITKALVADAKKQGVVVVPSADGGTMVKPVNDGCSAGGGGPGASSWSVALVALALLGVRARKRAVH